jgi:hypothetical protein
MELESAKYHATIRLTWDKQGKKWLLTAFDRTIPPSAKGRSFVPGAPREGGETGPSPEGGRVPPSGPGPDSGAPESSVAPGGLGDPTYMGPGLGALEPLFREAKAEGDALKKRRDEALAAAKLAADSPTEKSAGEKVRAYFTSERDLWAARTNQALDVIRRKVLPKVQDRETLGIARDGSHPFWRDMDGAAGVGVTNLDKLQPVLRQAQRILLKPTAKESAADAALTQIAERDLAEGRAGRRLESPWRMG